MKLIRFVRSLALPALLALSGGAHCATINFNGTAGSVPSPPCTLSGSTYTCTALPPMADDDKITIANGITVSVSSNVKLTFNQGLTMSGTAMLQTTGTRSLDIGEIKPSNLNVTGGTLAAGGLFKMGDQAQTLTATITAASMDLGGGSAIKITGSLTATGTIKIPSHAVINGPITGATITTNSPVTINGNVTASGNFNLASGSTVTGNVSAYNVTLEASSTKVNGDVTATNNLIIESGNGVNGNVSAHYAELKSANAYITGVASVDSIKLGSNATVQQYITCRAADTCNCLDNQSGNPTNTATKTQCQGTPAATLNRFKLKHDGYGLTCAPEQVEVTACTDAACTSKYTSEVKVTLAPGGTQVTLSNGVGIADVRQAVKGTSTISVAQSTVAASQGPLCERSTAGNACDITWDTKGLVLTVPDRRAGEATPAITVQAMEANPSTPAVCVPSIPNGNATINFACNYADPTTGTKGLNINGTGVACFASNATAAAVPVSLPFSGGKSTVNLSYFDAGRLQLAANYSTGGSSAWTDSSFFTVVPSKFVFFADDAAAVPNPLPNPFTKVNVTGSGRIGAVDKDGNITPNFGRETTPVKAALSYTFAVPVGGEAGNFTFQANPVTFSGGLAQFKATWDQVGGPELKATLENDANYPATSMKVSGIQVARFVPHRFSVNVSESAALDPVFRQMACNAALQTATSCTSYAMSGQPFELAITALDAGATVMKNYDGAFPSALNVSAVSARGAADSAPTQRPPGGAGIVSVLSASAFKNGQATAAVRYLVPAKAAPLPVFFRVFGTDGSSLADVNPSVNSTDALAAIVWGSVRVGNSYGSSRLNLPMTVTARYWDGQTYVASALATKTGIAQTALAQTTVGVAKPLPNPYGSPRADLVSSTPANCTLGLNAGGACVNTLIVLPRFLTFTNGETRLFLQAPNASGSAVITTIPFDFLDHEAAAGRANFGVYKSGPVIYLREVY
jgi:MSHA biogenesis protein MshQ